jgi:YVTN family beta-propeller protein
VDLRHNVLLTDLPLPGKAEAMFLKPDGGELYVTVPDAHGLTIINTYTHEVADSILLGAAPTRGVLDAETSVLYVSDAAAGHVIPVDMDYRAVETPIKVGEHPGSCRMDPGETHNLLLVVDEGSNDLAVIPSERSTNRSFITLIPLGNSPGDLAIKLF